MSWRRGDRTSHGGGDGSDAADAAGQRRDGAQRAALPPPRSLARPPLPGRPPAPGISAGPAAASLRVGRSRI